MVCVVNVFSVILTMKLSIGIICCVVRNHFFLFTKYYFYIF